MTPMREQVFEVIRRELQRIRPPHAAPIEIRPESSLVTDLGLDSLSMVEAVAAIEGALGLAELPLARWRDQELEKPGDRFTVASLVQLCLRDFARADTDELVVTS